jgi:hypothetical protein
MTLNTLINLEYLDLMATLGQSHGAVIDGFGGDVPAGYRSANTTEVLCLSCR